MKNIFVRLTTLGLLMAFYLSSAAQNKDARNTKKAKDSIFRVTHPGFYVPDSLHSEPAVRMLKSSRTIRQQDSLMIQRRSKPSPRKTKPFTVYSTHSDFKKTTLFKKDADSAYSRKVFVSKKQDTLRRLQQLALVKYDSSRKVYAVNVRQDSFHKYKLYQSVKLDSVKRKVYQQNMRSDSQRIKEYLRDKKIRYRDTVVVKDGYGSKKILMEITCNPGDTVYINSRYKKVIIKTIPSQKLRLSTTLFYKSELVNERSPETFKKMGIELSRTSTSVTAMINDTKQSYSGNTDERCIDDKIMENNAKRPLFIELPDNAIIVVNSKFAETNIENFVSSLDAVITNGSLRMGNADHARIKSYYGTIVAGEIKNAELNLSSTNFTASNIVSMSVVSTASFMKLDRCGSMNMASTGDEYNIDKASSISGNKDFGKLNIENLKDQLVLTGASANIKIDNLSYEAPFIKINNKYADLKLPLYDQRDYAVYYEGSDKDISKLSTATQKMNGMGTINARLSVQKDTLANINKTRFHAVAGNTDGRHTKVDIVCPYCNVVFN